MTQTDDWLQDAKKQARLLIHKAEALELSRAPQEERRGLRQSRIQVQMYLGDWRISPALRQGMLNDLARNVFWLERRYGS